MPNLTSKYEHGQKVIVKLNEIPMYAHVLSVHFPKPQKVKYDLEIKVYQEESTRIYNIEENFIEEFIQSEYIKKMQSAAGDI